jgi:hypothetical protein
MELLGRRREGAFFFFLSPCDVAKLAKIGTQGNCGTTIEWRADV